VPRGAPAEAGTEVDELAASVRLSVTRLGRILRQQDGGDLTPSTTSALAMVNRHGPLSLGELAAREHVAAPTVTRIVDKLQRAGLVSRRASEQDGRVAYVEVTDEGRARMAEVRSRRTRWLVARIETLSEDDLEVLGRAVPILERLVEQSGPVGGASGEGRP
jgi:DNA-binding MarR family transcriptional regulator